MAEPLPEASVVGVRALRADLPWLYDLPDVPTFATPGLPPRRRVRRPQATTKRRRQRDHAPWSGVGAVPFAVIGAPFIAWT